MYQSTHTNASQIALVSMLALAAATGACSISCVPTGNVGVVTRFGHVTGATLAEGINVVVPYYDVHPLSVRTQELKETSETPSEEGLIFSLDVSLLYHLSPATAANLYQTVGAG